MASWSPKAPSASIGRAPVGQSAGCLPLLFWRNEFCAAVRRKADHRRRIVGLFERLFYVSSIAWFFIVAIELTRIY